MNKPIIIVRPKGRMANQMFQLMLAIEISKNLGGAPILGYDLPEWGIIGKKWPKNIFLPDEMFLISNHRYNLNNVLLLMEKKILNGVVIEGWGMRLENFGPREKYQKLFISNEETPSLSEGELLIHIRAEDILSGWHRDYFPMAFSYFEKVISVTGLSPVFMGQVGEDIYSLALRKRFKGARFIPRSSPLIDFQTIRSSHNIALSISSFSWLAAWLSEKAKTIHMPFAGLFDPKNSGTNLIPLSDHRYRYYDVPFPILSHRKEINLVEWAEESNEIYELKLKAEN
jgi:hypothetical protein